VITGRSAGSGKYSFHETSDCHHSVMVAIMPEDNWKVRIVFRHMGETHIPITKLSTTEAKLLWASLKKVAEDMEWSDKMPSELLEVKK
jgi:hypothetical protein